MVLVRDEMCAALPCPCVKAARSSATEALCAQPPCFLRCPYSDVGHSSACSSAVEGGCQPSQDNESAHTKHDHARSCCLLCESHFCQRGRCIGPRLSSFWTAIAASIYPAHRMWCLSKLDAPQMLRSAACEGGHAPPCPVCTVITAPRHPLCSQVGTACCVSA